MEEQLVEYNEHKALSVTVFEETLDPHIGSSIYTSDLDSCNFLFSKFKAALQGTSVLSPHMQ